MQYIIESSYTFCSKDMNKIILIEHLLEKLYISEINGIKLPLNTYRCKSLSALITKHQLTGEIYIDCYGTHTQSTQNMFLPSDILLPQLFSNLAMLKATQEIVDAAAETAISYFFDIISGYSDKSKCVTGRPLHPNDYPPMLSPPDKRISLAKKPIVLPTVNDAIHLLFVLKERIFFDANDDFRITHLPNSDLLVIQHHHIVVAIKYGNDSAIGQVAIGFDIDDGFVTINRSDTYVTTNNDGDIIMPLCNDFSIPVASALQECYLKWKEQNFGNGTFSSLSSIPATSIATHSIIQSTPTISDCASLQDAALRAPNSFFS